LTLLKGGFYGTFIAYTLISITLGILAALAGGAVGTNHLSLTTNH
ncbi:fluoride efflux transporter CrcB, partial [Bacteroides cellulosilyticus]